MQRGSQNKRIQGVATQQTVKASPGTLRRINVSNGNAAAQTLTIFDGAAGTKWVLRIGAGASAGFEFETFFPTDIRVTPSAVEVDALVTYD